MVLSVAGEAETVIGVLKIGRDAGAGGAARDFRCVAPGTSARGAPGTFRRPLRIAVGGGGVVAGVEPVGAPFVDVCADVEEAESVLLCVSHGFGSLLPSRGIVCERLERGIAPGIEFLVKTSARGAFPFGFGGQAVAASRFFAQPLAIRQCVNPRRRDDGLLGMRENGIVPVKRFAVVRCGEELRVLRVGHLTCGQFECIHPNAMDGALIVLAGIAAHQEPALGDAHRARLDESRALGR